MNKQNLPAILLYVLTLFAALQTETEAYPFQEETWGYEASGFYSGASSSMNEPGTSIGHTVVRDDGVSYTTYGNKTFDNRGNSWTTYGNTTVGSDGSVCTRYGNEKFCE